MKERKLIICRGIQGSGKSTWAKQWCHEDPEHRVRFNNDDVRNMLGDYWVPSREKLVTEAKANMITFALIKGYDVVVDNMNLKRRRLRKLGMERLIVMIPNKSMKLLMSQIQQIIMEVLLERFTMIRMNLCGIMPNQLMGERLLLKV